MDQNDTRLSRRAYLQRGTAMTAAAISVGLSGCASTYYLHKKQQERQQATGLPAISFASQRQRITKQDATATVNNASELVSAVQKPNATVWIPEGVTINMTGSTKNPVAPNVTIASNRNLGDGRGGMIRTTGYDRDLFVVPEGSCRVTGIRLQGPRTDYFDPVYHKKEAYYASGIHFKGPKAVVDNCEVFGWTAQGISLGTKSTPTQGWIHHNDMHHNQMNHLGYPMELFNGMHLIEWNYFSHYRHAISGYGYETNGYEARFNVVGVPGGAPASFAFDMHKLGEQDNYPSGVETAGSYVNVHHNVFELKDHNAFSISGVPQRYARFANNWCATSKDGNGAGAPAVSAPSGVKVRMEANQFGSNAVSQGRKWLKQLSPDLPLSNGKPSIQSWSQPSSVSEEVQSSSGTPPSTEGGQ